MPSIELEQIFETFSHWRQGRHDAVLRVAEMISCHGVSDDMIAQRLHGVMHRLNNPSLRVAFVAEFSRGKSELINAVFFSGMGRRIMPASAGRTTMCPTEMGFDTHSPQGLYLLPIESRLVNRSLMHWRSHLDEWVFLPIDPSQPDAIAQTMQEVTHTLGVDVDHAFALGLLDAPASLKKNTNQTVEIPKWRHAMLNIDLPLLRQGLVVIDTPGLNAVGVEPELTLGLLNQVDAVVFILAADLGVSQSDLDIWQDHLLPPSETEHNRLAVLNKIDVLWDDLTPEEEIQTQLHSQKAVVAQRLGLGSEQVVLVSAQKGLVARIKHDEQLLHKSQLPIFESRMAHEVVRQHQSGLERQVSSGIAYALDMASMQLGARQHLLLQQVQELESMKGQNQDMIVQMRLRLQRERHRFNEGCQQVQAIRLVQNRLSQSMLNQLSEEALAESLDSLIQALTTQGMKWKGQKTFRLWFDGLKVNLKQLQQQSLEATDGIKQLGVRLQDKLGFSIQPAVSVDCAPVIHALEVVQADLESYFSMKYWWRMSRPGEVARWIDGVKLRLMPVLESAHKDIEQWNHALLDPLEKEVTERQRFFESRVEVIDRIERAAETVDEKLKQVEQELGTVVQALSEMDAVERA
jgi:hypothetical protein